MEAEDVQAASGGAVVTEDSILDRILEAHGHFQPPPGAFTVEDYMERARARGCVVAHPTALKELKAEVEAGRLNSRKLSVGDKERWYFWAV